MTWRPFQQDREFSDNLRLSPNEAVTRRAQGLRRWCLRILVAVILAVVVRIFVPPAYAWAMARTTQQWMGIIYPLLTSAAFVAGLLMLAYWYYVRRVTLVLANAFVFFSESAALFMLTVSTGDNPVFNIDDLRYWIVWARFAMLFSFALMNAICVIILIDHVRNRRKIVDFRSVVVCEVKKENADGHKN